MSDTDSTTSVPHAVPTPSVRLRDLTTWKVPDPETTLPAERQLAHYFHDQRRHHRRALFLWLRTHHQCVPVAMALAEQVTDRWKNLEPLKTAMAASELTQSGLREFLLLFLYVFPELYLEQPDQSMRLTTGYHALEKHPEQDPWFRHLADALLPLAQPDP